MQRDFARNIQNVFLQASYSLPETLHKRWVHTTSIIPRLQGDLPSLRLFDCGPQMDGTLGQLTRRYFMFGADEIGESYLATSVVLPEKLKSKSNDGRRQFVILEFTLSIPSKGFLIRYKLKSEATVVGSFLSRLSSYNFEEILACSYA